MEKETVWRIILVIFAIFFLISSLGYVNLVDYHKVADYMGFSSSSQMSSVIYAIVVLGIFLVLSAIYLVLTILVPKDNAVAEEIGGEIKSIGNWGYSVRNNGAKFGIGAIAGFIILLLFIQFGIFSCYTQKEGAAIAKYCGTDEQKVFLIASMVCIAYAFLPKNVASKKIRK
jgi:hypothetical protein